MSDRRVIKMVCVAPGAHSVKRRQCCRVDIATDEPGHQRVNKKSSLAIAVGHRKGTRRIAAFLISGRVTQYVVIEKQEGRKVVGFVKP